MDQYRMSNQARDEEIETNEQGDQMIHQDGMLEGIVPNLDPAVEPLGVQAHNDIIADGGDDDVPVDRNAAEPALQADVVDVMPQFLGGTRSNEINLGMIDVDMAIETMLRIRAEAIAPRPRGDEAIQMFEAVEAEIAVQPDDDAQQIDNDQLFESDRVHDPNIPLYAHTEGGESEEISDASSSYYTAEASQKKPKTSTTQPGAKPGKSIKSRKGKKARAAAKRAAQKGDQDYLMEEDRKPSAKIPEEEASQSSSNSSDGSSSSSSSSTTTATERTSRLGGQITTEYDGIEEVDEMAQSHAKQDAKDISVYIDKMHSLFQDEATETFEHDVHLRNMREYVDRKLLEFQTLYKQQRDKVENSKELISRVKSYTEEWIKGQMFVTRDNVKVRQYRKAYIDRIMSTHYKAKQWRPTIPQDKFWKVIKQILDMTQTGNKVEERFQINFDAIYNNAMKIPTKMIVDIEWHILYTAVTMIQDQSLYTHVLKTTEDTRILNKIVDIIARAKLQQTGKPQHAVKVVKSITTSGEIRVENENVVILNSQGDPVDDIKITAVQYNNIKSATKPDDFITKLLRISNTVIIDVDNVIKAMNVSRNELELFIAYLTTWGVTTIQILDDATKQIPNTEVIMQIAKHEHDDITMMVMSRVHNAVIMTSDTHSEFLDVFTFCTTHKTLQTRKNESCQNEGSGACKYRYINKLMKGKVMIRQVVLSDGRLKMFTSTDRVVERAHKTLKEAKTRYRAVYNDGLKVIKSKYWTVPEMLSTGPAPLGSHKYTMVEEPVTIMRASMLKSAMTVFCTNQVIALISILTEMSTMNLRDLKAKIQSKIEIEKGRIVLKDIKAGSVVDITGAVNPSANIYSRNIITMLSKRHRASTAIKGMVDITQINNQPDPMRKLFDLDDASICMTPTLLEEGIVVVDNPKGTFIMLVGDQFVQQIQTNAIAHMKSEKTGIGDIVYLLPLSKATKKMIARQYESADSDVHDGTTADYSITKGRWNSSLSRYFMEVDADKPSTQLMASPDNTTFVLATIATPVEQTSDSPQVFEYTGKDAIVEYYSSSIAMQIYTQWETMELTEKTIDIATVHWATSGIRSLNCNEREIRAAREALHEPTEVIVRDTTRDVLNIFNSIAKGYTNILVPPLVRATKCKSLRVKNNGQPIKLQIQWALPTCSVISRLIIHPNEENTVLASLVSVSPPITHNYLMAIANADATLENEYNTAICEMVEMETYGLFEYLMGKEDYMALYFAAYGIYSLGLKMLGLDPIEIIMKSSSAIEYGVAGGSLILTPSAVKTITTSKNIEEFLQDIIEGRGVSTIRLRISRGAWQKHLDVHNAIETTLKYIIERNYRRALMAWTISSVILSQTDMVEHLEKCYHLFSGRERLNFKHIYSTIITRLSGRLVERSRCIVKGMADPPNTEMPRVEIRQDDTMSIMAQGVTNEVSVWGTQKKIGRWVKSTTYKVVNYLPSQGAYDMLTIRHNQARLNKMTRHKNIIQLLAQERPLYITKTNVRIDNMAEGVQAIKEIIAQARSKKISVIIMAFDKFGSFYKTMDTTQKQTIYHPKWMRIYIPDQLLYNALRYDIAEEVVDTTEAQTDTIMGDGLDVKDEQQSHTAKPERFTFKNMMRKTTIKLIIVAFLFLMTAYFWRAVSVLLALPAMFASYFFPARVVGMTEVTWFAELLGTTPQPIYSTMGRGAAFFLNLVSVTWYVALLALVCVALGSFFYEELFS